MKDLVQLSPSATARRLLWHVFAHGTVTHTVADHYFPEAKEGIYVFWILSGRGQLVTDGRTYDLAPGPCCWLLDLDRPRLYHTLGAEPLRRAGVRFSNANLAAWRYALGPEREFTLSDSAAFATLCATPAALREFGSELTPEAEWRSHELVTALLGILAQAHVAGARAPALPPAIARVLETVRLEPARDWRVKELAGLAGVCPSTLRETFRRAQGESLHEFLQQQRVERARELLLNRQLSVKQVADRLNFSSEAYFSRFFRHRTGTSPTEFRHAAFAATLAGFSSNLVA